MRNFWRSLTTHVRDTAIGALAGLGLGALLIGPVAQALVIPGQFAPRVFAPQQTHYLRFAINFNSCVPVALTCSFKVGALPYNAFVVRAFTQTFTTFTGATTETVSFGTTAATTTELMAATTVLTAGNAVAQTIAAGGLGVTVTGNGIAQSGADGGFDVWARLTATVANPTAGAAVGIIEYIAPNDGACILVPMGSTSPGC
jgi:hypothetical protein